MDSSSTKQPTVVLLVAISLQSGLVFSRRDLRGDHPVCWEADEVAGVSPEGSPHCEAAGYLPEFPELVDGEVVVEVGVYGGVGNFVKIPCLKRSLGSPMPESMRT